MKKLIESGKFEELRRKVFNQKLEEGSVGTYTILLSDDEECLLAQQVMRGTPNSREFLTEYLRHYPLCNKAVDVFISQPNYDSEVKSVLLEVITRYGFNEKQGFAICNNVGLSDVGFMQKFCKSGRVFYIDLYQSLTFLGEEEGLGELYRKSVDAYRTTLKA